MSTNAASSSGWRKSLQRTVMTGRFLAVHLICLTAWWTGITWTAIGLFFGLYALRMFAITGGYHRYFSHRTYKMGRVMQFIMGFLAESSAQKGVLWWASHHRHHHTHSDDPDDVHSPKHHGIWYAHVGWLFDPDWADTDDQRIKDLSRYPELVWLDKYHMLPPIILGTATWLVAGWSGLVVGFFWSTVALWHATFTINSLSHVFGGKRYETGDESRNNWFLALITFGEGWHNNHHHYQASAAQGFYWWEYDITYYVLKAMEKVGLVDDVRTPPEHVVDDEPHPAVQAREEEQEPRESDEPEEAETPEAPADDATPPSERLEETVRGIRLSAAQAQQEASQTVQKIGLAAASGYDDLSDTASRQYTELSQAASEKADAIRESAKAAHEEAGKKVDKVIESLKEERSPEAT